MKISTAGPPGLKGIAQATRASYSALLQTDVRGGTLMSAEALQTILAMISISGIPILERSSPETERTWLWSDLHLLDRASVQEHRRPFRSWRSHDRNLKRRWRQAIAPEDTMIHVGDFAPEWINEDGRRKLLEELPGTKINILGNHDIRSILTPLTEGWNHSYGAMIIAATPPLVITHCPLRTVPAGAVNVHGHMHRRKDRTSDAHINVAVEQIAYHPVEVGTIIEEARRRLGGEAPTSLRRDQ